MPIKNKLIIFTISIFAFTLNGACDEKFNPPTVDQLASFASSEELAFIDKQLMQLDKLSEFEKTQLRKLITDIKIRETKDIAKNTQALEAVKREIEQEQWLDNQFTSPEQIRKTRSKKLQEDEAKQSPIYKVTHLTHSINLDLNAPEVVEIPIAINWGTTIIFVDRYGSPFPIQSVGDFTGSKFSLVSKGITKEDNILTVSNEIAFATANASIFLADQNIPLMLTFASNQKVNTTRLIIRVQQTSPLTHLERKPAISAQGVDSSVYAIADYNVPAGAKKLKVSHNAGDAWLIDDHIVLRTDYKLLSPFTADALESNTNGIKNVYRLPFYSRLLLNIDDQKIIVSISKQKTVNILSKQGI